jgi:hypothetical protein
MLWQTITKRYGLLVADYYGFNQITDMIFTVFYKKYSYVFHYFVSINYMLFFRFVKLLHPSLTDPHRHRYSTPSLLLVLVKDGQTGRSVWSVLGPARQARLENWAGSYKHEGLIFCSSPARSGSGPFSTKKASRKTG